MEEAMSKKIRKECESSCEYILPDYMGDIRKILMSRAKAIPTGKFLSGDSLEVGGIVEYEILYSDSDGRLTAISATSDYEMKFPVDSEGYSDSTEESTISNLGIRITGPRKIIMKAAVESVVRISEEPSLEIEGDAFASECEPETAARMISCEMALVGRSGEREYAEAAEFIADVRSEEIITEVELGKYLFVFAPASEEILPEGKSPIVCPNNPWETNLVLKK